MNDDFLLEEEFHHNATRGLTIRLGRPADAAAIDRVATLDDRDPGAAPHLVADEDGEIVASLSLSDGAVVADPFRRTLGSVALLRLRAAQLGSGSAPRGSRSGFRSRLVLPRASSARALS